MLAEKPITLREAAGLMPVRSSGKRFAKQMIRPRIMRGARPEAAADPDHCVRLQAVQIGKSLHTSKEAIRRFIERLTRPDHGDTQVGRLAAILRRYVDGRPRIFVGLEPIGRDDPDFCQWIPAADVISCG
jgi:hypothetical protein